MLIVQIKMLRLWAHRRVWSRFNSSVPKKNRHDFDGNLDEINAGHEKFYGKDAKWTDYFTKGKEFRAEKRAFRKLNYAKYHKDFMYAEASREMRGFVFEHTAAWAITDYGEPEDVIARDSQTGNMFVVNSFGRKFHESETAK